MSDNTNKYSKTDLALDAAACKSTRTISFTSIPIRERSFNVALPVNKYLLSTKILLWAKSLLKVGSIEVTISKVDILWCPLIEPTVDSMIEMKVSYRKPQAPGLRSTMSDTIAMISGISTEHLGMTIYPTKSSIILKGHNISLPWNIQVMYNEAGNGIPSSVLGEVKIWAHMDIKRHRSEGATPSLTFKEPEFSFTNLYRPYQTPICSYQAVRGIKIVDNVSFQQYKDFTKEVLVHINDSSLETKCYWELQNLISTEDRLTILDMTKLCLYQKGGSYCTCKENVIQFVEEIRKNSTKWGIAAGSTLDSMKSSIKEGRIHDIGSISFHRK
nr:MAG: movement protein [Picris betanucleorhabdovirus 1]